MFRHRAASPVASVLAFAVALVLAAAPPARAATCSCTTRQKSCIDTVSKGPNALCASRKCPAGATFSTEPCPRKDVVATCSLTGPDYVTHNRYYAPLWKLETVKSMCAGMKGELAPGYR